MKILVTGGAGFIGSNVADAYAAAGHRVVIIDNLSSGKKSNINPKAKFYQVDIRDKKKIDLIFKKERPQIVNHHAAQIDVRKSILNPAYNAEVNEIGTINLLEASVKYKVKKFIFASTGGALYGEVKERAGAAENHKLEPISPYAITKRSSEMYLLSYHENFGLNYTVLRYGNVFGPRQDPYGEAGVIAIFIGKMLKNDPPYIFGSGKQLRDYVFVQDVCKANLLALKKGNNKIYNIGTGKTTSVNQLFKELKTILGFQQKAIYAPARAGELFRSALSIKKAKTEFGWSPKTDLVKGLKKTVEYFK